MAILNTIFLGFSTLALVVLVAVGVFAFLEFRKMVRTVRPFAETAGESLPSAIAEVNLALRSLRDATDEAISIMREIKEISGAARTVADNVKRVSEGTRRITEDVGDVTSAISGRISGIRAGVRVALAVIEKGLRTK